mmetsp:Transcript_5273/g.16101  ORF Transcript_5273/g.16101 Transcript_5273/m.16101 type:complete len:507 (-) Transcript_5273:1768-3288(-)
MASRQWMVGAQCQSLRGERSTLQYEEYNRELRNMGGGTNLLELNVKRWYTWRSVIVVGEGTIMERDAVTFTVCTDLSFGQRHLELVGLHTQLEASFVFHAVRQCMDTMAMKMVMLPGTLVGFTAGIAHCSLVNVIIAPFSFVRFLCCRLPGSFAFTFSVDELTLIPSTRDVTLECTLTMKLVLLVIAFITLTISIVCDAASMADPFLPLALIAHRTSSHGRERALSMEGTFATFSNIHHLYTSFVNVQLEIASTGEKSFGKATIQSIAILEANRTVAMRKTVLKASFQRITRSSRQQASTVGQATIKGTFVSVSVTVHKLSMSTLEIVNKLAFVNNVLHSIGTMSLHATLFPPSFVDCMIEKFETTETSITIKCTRGIGLCDRLGGKAGQLSVPLCIHNRVRTMNDETAIRPNHHEEIRFGVVQNPHQIERPIELVHFLNVFLFLDEGLRSHDKHIVEKDHLIFFWRSLLTLLSRECRSHSAEPFALFVFATKELISFIERFNSHE